MSTDPATLVRRFYAEIWNRGDEAAAAGILAEDLRFRGSLGSERRGRDGFLAYVREVRGALGGYTCEIESLIVEGDRAAARMRFFGTHRAPFFGVEATGREIVWAGAAFFRIQAERIAEIWVLGDIDGVKAQLGAPSGAQFD